MSRALSFTLAVEPEPDPGTVRLHLRCSCHREPFAPRTGLYVLRVTLTSNERVQLTLLLRETGQEWSLVSGARLARLVQRIFAEHDLL